jgi:tRNA(Glu) U13 pseudouridine synthase TruD
MDLPYITAALPGTGGTCPPRSRRCEEVLSTQPGGSGDYWWIHVLKDGLGTTQVRQAIARAAHCAEDDVACAGHRDRHTVTSQWLSVPSRPVDHPNQLRQAGAYGKMRVLAVQGAARPVDADVVRHLRWNLRLTGAGGSGYLRARAVLDALRRAGMANFVDGDLVDEGQVHRGRQAVAGRGRDADPARSRWALQAWLFNRACAHRVATGTLGTIQPGDVIDAGGDLAIANDPAVWQKRADNLACHPAGPWFGPGMPPAAGEVAALEADLLAEAGVAPAHIERLGPGHRRPYRVQPRQVQVMAEKDAILIACELPVDAHIGVLLREVIKLDAGEGPAEAADP